MKRLRSRLKGFTLIELLVVMGILTFLFSLGVAFLPAVYQRWESAKGADMVVGTLARARQEARRSGRPTGVRLIVIQNPFDAVNTAHVCMEMRFVQQPVDLTVPGSTLSIPAPASLTSDLTTNAALNVQQTATCSANLSGLVQARDTLIVNEGLPCRISNNNPSTQLIINGSGLGGDPTRTIAKNPINYPAMYPFPDGLVTQNYRIVRAPRLIQGEQSVFLPAKVGIDIDNPQGGGCTTGTSWTTPVYMQPTIAVAGAGSQRYYDILFAPNGSLTGQWIGTDRMILYVRDVSQSDPTTGLPTLVVIYGRTGFIGAQPVGPPPNFYKYAMSDSRWSGM